MLSIADVEFVQLETSSLCNYRCVYCPVAHIPRPPSLMTIATAKRIIDQFSDFPNLRNVYLNGYDEPTLNPNLAEIADIVLALPVRLTLFTNGTRITDQLIDVLATNADRVDVDVHLSSVHGTGVRALHGVASVEAALEGLRRLSAASLESGFRLTAGVQLLKKDALHLRWAEEAIEVLEGMGVEANVWEPNDRAGLLKIGNGLPVRKTHLAGCALEERTRKWLHIAATGHAIICCQDYEERYLVGDTAQMSLKSIALSNRRLLYDRWATGALRAPTDFICRTCSHALARV
jgi:hypothetical protein